MALIVNGTTIPTDKPFMSNGKPVHRVVANGKVVWELKNTPAIPTTGTKYNQHSVKYHMWTLLLGHQHS